MRHRYFRAKSAKGGPTLYRLTTDDAGVIEPFSWDEEEDTWAPFGPLLRGVRLGRASPYVELSMPEARALANRLRARL